MPALRFLKARTLLEALQTLAEHKAGVPIAGGTDLMLLYRDGLISPESLIDISGIPELSGIQEDDSYLKLGACTTLATISRDPRLPTCLREGASSIGSPQIRNLGTIGGNVCNASPCGDTLTPLLALDAIFTLKQHQKERQIRSEEFFTGPKKTILKQGELLTDILIPAVSAKKYSGFSKIGGRRGQIISQVNIACSFFLLNGKISQPRIAVGSVAPVPLRIFEAEDFLAEKEPTPEILEKAGEIVSSAIKPITDQRATAEYRRSVSRVLFLDLMNRIVKQVVT